MLFFVLFVPITVWRESDKDIAISRQLFSIDTICSRCRRNTSIDPVYLSISYAHLMKICFIQAWFILSAYFFIDISMHKGKFYFILLVFFTSILVFYVVFK
jgi:hypothetical protein